MTFLIPAAGALLEYALTDSATDASLTTSFSFASRNFGTAYPDRYIIAILALPSNNRDASACTIGGVTASKLAGNSDIRRASIWGAAVPTGTTGTVAITADGTSAGCGLHIYSIYPIASLNTSNLSTNGGSITVPAAGFAIGGGYTSQGGSTPTMSLSGLTEDATVTWSSSGILSRLTVGSVVGTGAAVTVTATGSTAPPFGFAVSAFGV